MGDTYTLLMFLEEPPVGLCLSRLLTCICTCLISIRYLYALHSLLPLSISSLPFPPTFCLTISFPLCACMCVCVSVCRGSLFSGWPTSRPPDSCWLSWTTLCMSWTTDWRCVCAYVCVVCVHECLLFYCLKNVLANFKQCDDFFCRLVYVCASIINLRHSLFILTVTV